MYLGTFSKILSPGIRLGWVVAPPPVLEKINLGKQAADLCSSTLSQLMVIAYFEQGRWRAALLKELEHAAREAPDRRVETIFFGGGTPSLMEPATVGAVIFLLIWRAVRGA